MYSLSSKPRTKLWVVTLGIVISIIIFTPPCSPLMEFVSDAWGKLVEITSNHINKEKVESGIVDFIEVRQTD